MGPHIRWVDVSVKTSSVAEARKVFRQAARSFDSISHRYCSFVFALGANSLNNVHPVKYKNNCLNPRLCNYGRRVAYHEMNGTTQLAHAVFLYNGYLCIQQIFSNEPWNVYKEFIWDSTEPVATRPLAFRQYGKTTTFLLRDGNKNISVDCRVLLVTPSTT